MTDQVAIASRPLLSLAMIVRNEAANLHNCLISVEGLFDEIVVVDTGSTDNTVDIAQSLGAKVFHFPWCDDFSAARNCSLKHCSGTWCMYLDADEWLLPEDRHRLLNFKAELGAELRGYLLKQLSNCDSGRQLAIDQVRIFPIHPQFRWEGLVHEQIGSSLIRTGVPIVNSGIVLQHSGYQSTDVLNAKSVRNFELLRRQVAHTPDDPMAQFHWGQALLKQGDTSKGLAALEFAHERMDRGLLVFRHIACTLLETYVNAGRIADAWRVIQSWPVEREIPHAMLVAAAKLHEKAGRRADAEACLQQAATRPPPKTATHDDPLIASKARYQLAWLKFEQKRVHEAFEDLQMLLNEKATEHLGHKGLGIMQMLLGRHQDALGHAEKLLSIPHGQLDGMLLQAQVWSQTGQLSAARQQLEQLSRAHPHDVNVQNFLAQAYLRDQTTWPQARETLQRVLQLDPQHAEALHNLAVINKATGGSKAV